MSQIGKKNFRHKLGNRSKKLSISKLRQQQADGEQEYQQLTNEINKYYDSLIDHIQQEREQIITELEKVFSTRAVDVKNRIDSTEIAAFTDLQSTPFLEYFFKEVHYPIANFNSHAFLLNHIFLAEENMVRKSILNGFGKNFIRAAKHHGQYYYLTTDMDNLLYKSENLELYNAIPMRVVQRSNLGESKKALESEWDTVPPQDKSDDWDSAVWDTREQLEPPEDEWYAPTTPLDTDWGTPVLELWDACAYPDVVCDWGDKLPKQDVPFDFVIVKNYVFITFQISKVIGSFLLTNRLTNKNNISSKFLSQPRGMCVLEDYVNLIYIADLDSKKVCAFAKDDFINSAALDYDNELECEFTVLFGESEYPLLLHENETKREILVLTLSNTIFFMSATGSVLHKLAYTEFTSPYDMKVVEGGKILIVDLESLVVLDANGACMSKYFSDRFSYRGCINCTESYVEVIVPFKDMEYAGVENIEICLL